MNSADLAVQRKELRVDEAEPLAPRSCFVLTAVGKKLDAAGA